MSGLDKQLLFGIWALLLTPLIAPVLKQWLAQNTSADSRSMARTASHDATAATAFAGVSATSQQPWFGYSLVFLSGIVVGVTLEWLNRKSGEKKAVTLPRVG